MKTVFKKWVGILLMFTMVIGMLPAAPNPAKAADYYFIPDIAGIRNTRNLDLSNLTTSAYAYNNSSITITGTFQSIDSTSITVKVEQLITSGTSWTADTSNYYTSGATISGMSFTANALSLFPGYNRVTFTGLQGSVERSESFYILYNDMPMLNSMMIGSASDTPVNLNEGTQVVVKNKTVYLKGNVQNATQIIFNGTVAYPQSDGTFYSPTMTLSPGKNTITIEIKNAANSLTVQRTVYYYDANDPFIAYKMKIASGNTYDLDGNVPTITDTGNQATFNLQLLLPNLQNTAEGHTTISLNGTDYTSGATITEVPILNGDGVTIDYRLVNITTATPYTLASTSPQTVTALVYYTGTARGFSASIAGKFSYLPGETAVSSISLLKDYNGTATDLSNISAVSLDGSEVNDDEFYVAVTADKNYASSNLGLEVRLLPYSTTTLGVTYIGSVDNTNTNSVTLGDTTSSTLKKIYKISGLPNGSQDLQFIFYTGTTTRTYMQSSKNATVNYVSQNYIKIDNLYDGEIITINSKSTVTSDKQVKVTGRFVGFNDALSPDDSTKNQVAQMWVNSTKITNFHTTDGATNNFSYTIDITESGDGKFHYGQNTLVLEAQYQSTSGTDVRTVHKELTIYIQDSNVATIEALKPGAADNRGTLSTMSDSEIFKSSYDKYFTLSSGVYTSANKTYDVILKGLNATKVVIKKNGETIDTYAPGTDVSATSGTNFKAYGNQDKFYVRVEGMAFTTPETHTYVFELYNSTGAKISQTIQIKWSYNSYTILAPKANVGNNIVVNKNFVTVDIQAEGATSVLVAGNAATKKQETSTTTEHFVYEYVGLKPDKDNTIKFQIVRDSGTVTGSIVVHYTSSVQTGSEYKQEMGTKFTLFDKGLQLTFPKNTVLKKADPSSDVNEFYSHNLRFGIASATDGVVERQNDYGSTISASGYLYYRFSSTANRSNFTPVSPYYWVSGGIGEDTANSITEKDGLDPYDTDGTFVTNSTERKLIPTNRGSLTLKFNSSVVDSVGSIVTVFYLGDDTNSGWQRIGGTVDTKNNTITVPFDDFGYYMVAKLRVGFSDITNHSWARNILEAMYAKGYMENLRYQEFGSYDYATRGEFATLLVKSLNIPLVYDDNQTFLDVYPTSKSTTWEYKYIETAARVGIITGYDNQIFSPDGRLTREQAATMIARAMELKLPTNDSKLQAQLEKLFTDTSSMSYYAKPSIYMVYKAGIMLGVENALVDGQTTVTYRFNPTTQLQRDEAAQIAVRLLQKYTSVFPANLN